MASDGSSSGGSFIGGLIGGIIGFVVTGFNPAGAVKGFMYGSTIGGLLAPPTGPDQFGPRLDSLKITTSSNTATLPRSYGTVAHQGNIIWAKGDEYVEVTTVKKVKTGFFSKTKVTTYTYFFTGAIAFARSEASAILRVWHQGGNDLVYSATSTDPDTQVASAEFLKYVTFYYGTADQPKDPLISAAENEIHTSPYLGVIYLVYDMYPLEKYQNNIGMLDPKVEYTTVSTTAADLDHLVDVPADPADTDQDRYVGLHNATRMSAEGVDLWRIGKSIEAGEGVAVPAGRSPTGEIYHYLANASGQLLLKQEYEDALLALSPTEEIWDPWTKVCKGKSDRNVAVFTRGVIKTGGPGDGDGGAAVHPGLLIPGAWKFEQAFPVPDFPVPFTTFWGALEYAMTPEQWGTYEELFTEAENQTLSINDDGEAYGIVFGLPYFHIFWEGDGEAPPFPYPLTADMYENGSSRFMRYQLRVLDVDNDTDIQYRVHVDASVETPSDQTYYVFYEDTLYFVYTYTDHYVIVKINPDGSKDVGGRSHATSLSVVKIGILNDQLIVVIDNADAANFDIFDLDLAFVETKNAAYIATQFGGSTSALYNNISFDFDRVYFCLSGNMKYKDSLTAAAVDMGTHTGLILGTNAPVLFNIFGTGNLIADSTHGGTMPNVGIQFFSYGVVAEPGKIPLADIIEAENALVGIESSDLILTTITQLVRGYVVSEIGPVRNVLSQLQAIFPFDVIQSGYKNAYIARGLSSVATVTWQELGPGISLTQDREMETQLPYKVELTYIDYDLDYQPNVQFAERRNDSKNIVRLNIPIVLTASEAAQAAEILLNIYHLERRTFAFVLPPTYRNLEPSDIITLAMKDVTYVVRLTNIHYLANGQMECTAKQHMETVYVSTAPGATGSIPKPTTIPSIANPILGVLDIPVINDAQNKPGYTSVVTHSSDSWVGGSLFRARDGVTYEQIQAFSVTTVWGTCLTSLNEHGGHLIDEGGSLTVRPIKGVMPDFTEAQMLNEESMLAYGRPGQWELICYKNSTDNADGTYTLDTFTRGRRGTEWASGLHTANDYFAFVNDGTAKFVNALLTDLDQVLKHKAITTGRDLDSASVVNLTYGGVNLTPLAPTDPFDVRDGSGNVTGYFSRQSRLTGGLTPVEALALGRPIGEASESYIVEILDGADVVRTISTTAESFPYSAADQTTDFGSLQTSFTRRIRQVSATVGPGYALEATI
jgi:hypothetical protein